MRLRSISRLIAFLAIGGLLTVPAAALAITKEEIYLKIYEDYAVDGQISPCKHTSEELQATIKIIPADLGQYGQDYKVAMQAALRARARGDCDGTKPQAAPLTRPAPAPAATPTVAAPTPEPTPVPTAIPTKTVVPEPPQPVQAPAGTLPVSQAAPPAELQRVATAIPDNDPPAPVLVLAILAGLALIPALLLAAMRRFGWAEDQLAGPRHAFAEAGWRLGGMWEDFRDWVRLGR